MKSVVYIAGPFRGPHAWAIERNVRRAEWLAHAVWALGAVALCPHMNTRFFQGSLPDRVWLEGDLELLRRCDAVLLAPGWRKSHGTCREVKEAFAFGIPVFSTLKALQRWIQKSQRQFGRGARFTGTPGYRTRTLHSLGPD
jgi:hypothetical protein